LENDIVIKPTHRIVVLEGNYVHLTVPPWDQATHLLDERWLIVVDRDVARRRVIQRHIISGIVNTEAEAGKRFDENDWPNGLYLLENSDVESAHRKIESVQDHGMSERT
jgi:pantothenate kinase